MKKVLIVLGIIVLVLIIGVVLVLGYFGVIPGVSSLMGTNKPRDLGITYTQQDYDSAYKKGGQSHEINTKNVSAQNTIVTSGSKKVDAAFTDEEITAAINEHPGNWVSFPASDVQVRINDDGTAELSGYLLKDRLEGFGLATGVTAEQIEIARPYVSPLPAKIPAYIKVSASSKNNQLSLELIDFEAGRIPIPGAAMTVLQNVAENFVQDTLNAFDVRIENAYLKDGTVQFKGELAETMETYSE